MDKCEVDLKKIRSKVKTINAKYIVEKWDLNTLKSKFIKTLEEVIPQNIAITSPTLISDEIYGALSKSIIALNSNFFNSKNILNLITGINQGLVQSNNFEVSAELASVQEVELVGFRKGITSEFLDNAYGLVSEARKYAVQVASQNLFDVLFINRGSIEGQELGLVKSNLDLNRNIRNYQEQLLKKIVKYLNTILDVKKLSPEEQEALLNPKLYNGNTNTGILKTLESFIDNYLSRKAFASDQDPSGRALEGLRSLYNLANNPNDPKNKAARLRLDAYNAAVILRNFDKFLVTTLGDIIDIQDISVKTGKDNKYAIGKKTAKLLSTWSTSEDRDVESEADFITKLAINTTPIYNYDGRAVTGKFLTFADYQYIIGKIKDLAWNEKAISHTIGNINIAQLFEKPSYWDSLASETKEEIKRLTEKNGKAIKVSTLINMIRRNPRKYVGIIFDLLSSRKFLETIGFGTDVFSEGDLKVIYSLNKGVFSSVQTKSLYSLSDLNGETDFYSFITLVADTIFSTNYVLYYRDADGILLVRTFISQNINNLRRTIETTINTSNNTNTIGNFNNYINELLIVPVSETEINFTIPGTEISVAVDNVGKAIFKEKGLNITSFEKFFQNPEVLNFLDLKLRLGITDNIDLQKALGIAFKGNDIAMRNLLSFASRIVLNLYVIHNKIDSLNAAELLDEINKLSLGVKYNKLLDIVDVIAGYDISNLRMIAIAKANVLGLTTATQTKDGEGNGLSLQTLSRLLGSHWSLFELQETLPWSATKDCLILTVPGLYEGGFTSKEYYDEFEGSKSFVDMCVSEFSYASFVLDYIGGLISRKNEKGDIDTDAIVGNGHVMFIPSVNSDKGTIGRIKINLNSKIIGPDGKTKAIREFNHDELRWLIAKQFGLVYTRMYESVKEDWNIVNYYIQNVLNIQGCPNLGVDYLHNFKLFNTWWYQNRKTLLQYGKNPTEFIKYVTLQYNQSYKLNPISILDYVHRILELWDCPDFITDRAAFNTWWQQNKGALSEYGNSPTSFIKNINQRYEKSCRLNPLTLIDLTHFKSSDLNLNVNGLFVTVPKALTHSLVLISQIARFNPNYLTNTGIDVTAYPSADEFWQTKHKEILKSLLKSRFLINTTGKNLEELKYLREKYPSWINDSGNVILAKITYNGKPYNITATRDLIRFRAINENLTDAEIIDSLQVQLHPAIATWNYLDYLFTLEFMDCTVGSFINHPEKSKGLSEESIRLLAELKGEDPNPALRKRVLEREAAHFQALHKRNVSFTASMHEFELNLLNGITEDYNIAVIEDIKDFLGTITGILNTIKPFDGATFVNPFIVLLENFSLAGARAGITKKQFVHFKNERTGTGGIIKTAGFGLTNDWIRNSPFLQKMMQKMTDHIWFNEDGSLATADITKDYRGNPLTYDNMYFELNGRVFEILAIESLGNNLYRRLVLEIQIDEDGNPIRKAHIGNPSSQEFTVNTNYQLWLLFGADHSMSVNGEYLEYSNSSIENVVKAMNNVAAIDSNGNIITRNGTSVDKIKTLDDLWQPLKHSDVHYVATAGAVKLGAANINSANKYIDDVAYDIQRIKMYQAGIQLDKEHHADDAELSLMTLVISACAAKGYTFEAASKLYEALRKSTEIGIKDHLDAVRQYITSNDPSGVREAMYEAIINSLGTSLLNGTNFAYLVASDLIRQAREGKKIKFADVELPLSDKTVRGKIFSTIASYLTNSGIKLKIPGILSVLTPSYNIFKIYAGKKLEAYKNPKEDLARELVKFDANPVFDIDSPESNISNIELGRTYKITRYNDIDFTQPNIVGVSLESAYRNVIYNRLYYSEYATPLIKSLITRILNSNSTKSLGDVINSIVALIPNPEELQILRSNLIHLVNEPISDTRLYTNDLTELKYLYKILGSYTSIENLQSILYGNREILRESLKRYNLDLFLDSMVQGASDYVQRNGVDLSNRGTNTHTTWELINNPLDYKRIKDEISDNGIISISEAVIDREGNPLGRDLAAYNVRFLTITGELFQLWDLDSAVTLFTINEIKGNKNLTAELKTLQLSEIAQQFFPNRVVNTNDLEKLVRRVLLKDLMNLSNTTPNILALYDELLKSQNTYLTTQSESLKYKWATTAVNSYEVSSVGDSRFSAKFAKFKSGTTFMDMDVSEMTIEDVYLKLIKKSGKGLPPAKDSILYNPTLITKAERENYSYQTAYLPLWQLWASLNLTLIEDLRQTVKGRVLTDKFSANTTVNQARALADILTQTLRLNNTDNLNLSNWYDHYAQWVNIYLGTGNGSKIDINGILTSVTAENFEDVEKYVRQLIQNTTLVKIGGNLYTVNKQSIKVSAYEIIMPKTFATNFGLKPFDSVSEISNDRDWFVKQYERNSTIKIEDEHYSVALKTSNGNHTYLLSKSLIDTMYPTFTKVDRENIGLMSVDGKTVRLDTKGNIMYEVSDDFELWVDSLGNEVIATDDFKFYINNTSFESIQLSRTLLNRTKIFEKVLEDINESKNKVANWFYRYLGYSRKRRNFREVYDSNLIYNDVSKNTTLIRSLHEKHSSFLKSLDVVAARIPSLSMQSFMPMRVIAFDNPDINTAYVSTLLILLQGSDYDVDAVSIATYDIDRNGKLLLWSPYANLETIENLEASLKLPIPTGLEVNFKESNGYLKTKEFFAKYKPILWTIRARDEETGIPSDSEAEVILKDIKEPQHILMLGEFLKKVLTLEKPSKRWYELFIKEVNDDGSLEDKFTAQHVESIFAKLKQLVDKHNLYYESLSSYRLSKVTNNSTMNNTFEVSKDPVNLLQAHTSVDATTGPLKDKAETSSEASEANSRTPGNVINKFESINENQVGKKGISICATGLKSYFGLTQYCNWVLNHGTVKELEHLLLGNDHKGITIGGNTYYTLANIRALNLNTIKNSELFAALSKITLDEDIALTLSALLSLATDNAKELALSKLNAGTKMLGMYIYGLSIGMKFDDIADILMSPVGNIIKNMLDDDKFSGREAFGVVDERIFKYFMDGPYRHLLKFDISYDSLDNMLSYSPTEFLNKKLADKLNLKDEKTHKPLKLTELLVTIAKSNITLVEKIKIFEELRKEYSGSIKNSIEKSNEAKEIYNLLIDFVEDYILLADVIWKNQSIFTDISKLAEGALEMKILGQILSLNLGIKTTSDEFMTQINNLRRAIYNKTGDLEDIVDLTKFTLDDNPYTAKDGTTYSSYREYVIDKYETIKVAFNIFDAITKVPHFMGYSLALAIANVEVNNAFTFRSSDNLLLITKEQLGGYVKEDKLVRGLLNYCGDWLIKHWMLDSNTTITIPAGNLAFDKNGNLYTLTEDKVLHLGLDEDNATFRLWMENEVIPNLKKGLIKPNMLPWPKISNNKFIKDLGYNLYNKTVSRNNTIVQVLPINMLPNTDIERNMFNLYKSEFNDLTDGYLTKLSRYITNSNGTVTKEEYLSKSIAITDLFTYYAMLANGWKLDLSSLVSITEDFLNTGIIKDFHDYISEIDKSGFTLSMDNIIWDELLPYVAPSESPYSSTSNVIWAKNKETLKRVLMDRKRGSSYSDTGVDTEYLGEYDSTIGKYSPRTSINNLNFFGTNQIDSGEGRILIQVKLENNPLEILINYDLISNDYDILIQSTFNQITSEELKTKLLEVFKTIPMIKANKTKIPDMLLLKQCIEQIINCG